MQLVYNLQYAMLSERWERALKDLELQISCNPYCGVVKVTLASL